MELTVLMDNNTIIDRYLIGEPALSFLIKEEDKTILFDVGYSDAFLKNSNVMNIDLYNLDYIVISHGHMDHTWGLFYLIKHYIEAAIEEIDYKMPQLIAHPWTFYPKIDGNKEIGSIITADTLSRHFVMKLGREPLWLTKRLVYLGEIERSNDFENKEPMGKIVYGKRTTADYLMDDTAMAYKSDDGLVIITGCSHAGICNIIEHAKKICEESRVIDVIGGFHLLEPSFQVIRKTCDYLYTNKVENLHPCHCTDLFSKIELSNFCNVGEVGVGMVLKY